MTTRVDLCPHCGQNMTWRRRALNASMARTLLRLLWCDNNRPGQFVHAPSLKGDNHEVSQLAWWGLVEEKPDTIKDDGNPHAGYWRITAEGKRFARAQIRVPSHAWTFNTRYQKPELDETRLISIREVKNFNYDDLIAGLG